MKYFEVSFDNFAGDCISCDVSIDDTISPFKGASQSDIDLIFRHFFLKYRLCDEFVALIPIVVDETYNLEHTVPFYDFFMFPQPWY